MTSETAALTKEAALGCLDYLKLVDAWLHAAKAPDEIFQHTLNAESCMAAMIDRIWPQSEEEIEDDGTF